MTVTVPLAATATLPPGEVSTVDEPRDLTTADVLRVAGCTYRQLDYWCRSFGLCGSDRMTDREQGTGYPRWFTRTEARAARTLRLVGDAGVNVGMYARAVLQAMVALPGATHLVLTTDTATTYTDATKLAEDVVAATAPCVVVAVLLPEDVLP